MFRGKLNDEKIASNKETILVDRAILLIIAFLIDLNSRIITLKALQQQKSILSMSQSCRLPKCWWKRKSVMQNPMLP